MYMKKQLFLDNFERRTVGDKNVQITAVKFKNHNYVKNALLADYVISDLLYFAIALGLVFFVMLVHLRSVALLLSMLLNVIVQLRNSIFCLPFCVPFDVFPLSQSASRVSFNCSRCR